MICKLYIFNIVYKVATRHILYVTKLFSATHHADIQHSIIITFHITSHQQYYYHHYHKIITSHRTIYRTDNICLNCNNNTS